MFKIVAIATQKPPKNTKKDRKKVLLGKFYEKEMIKVN